MRSFCVEGADVDRTGHRSEDAPPHSGAASDPMAHLWAAVYTRLRRRARRLMASERTGHTLQPTALVHDAFVAISAQRQAPPSAEMLLAAGALTMRRLLIDSVRQRRRIKRGGRLVRMDIDPDEVCAPALEEDLVALDDAISALERVEPDAARVVTLRYFGGMTLAETARVLGISCRSVDRLWAFARSWLLRELHD